MTNPDRDKAVDRDTLDEARALRTKKCLWELLEHAKSQVDPATWIRVGGFDVEEFLQCLDDGLWHPLLRQWEERKGTDAAHRASPTPRQIMVRRMAVLMVLTLERTGLNKRRARKSAAEALAEISLLFDPPHPPSVNTLEHWERAERARGEFTEKDEQLIASAIRCCSQDQRQICDWFVGLIDLIHDPITIRVVIPPPP
jgi:hypothetical protein